MRFAVFRDILLSCIHPRWLRLLAGLTCLLASGARGADDFPAPTRPTSSATSALTKRTEVGKESQKPSEQRIDQLIRELGSPQFPTRRAAAHELRQIGAEAFDQLYAATDSPDPEIAASAGYLLRQVPVRWF